ncbi:MAG: sigma-70 family RNA polymerase sigma factor [Cyclobacteriaceae bacterium]
MKFDNASDQVQWEALRNGDTGAFSILYERYAKMLLSYGRKVHNDRQMVADAVQELFTYLWNRRSYIGGTPSVKFYLIKALRSIIIKELNKASRNSPMLTDQDMDSHHSREFEIIHNEEEEAAKLKMKLALGGLSKREQEILYLKYFTGASNEEIAELLDINYQSVKNTSFSAIKKLRKHFGAGSASMLLTFILLQESFILR